MGSSWVQGGSEGLLHVPALGSRQYKTNWSAYFLGWRPQSPRVRITVDATKQSLDSTAKDGEGHWKWQRTSTKVTGQEKQHPLQTSVRKKPEEDEGWGPGEMGYWKNPGLPGLPYQPHQWTIQPITSWWHSVSERILNHLFLKKEIFNFPQQVCQSQGKKKKSFLQQALVSQGEVPPAEPLAPQFRFPESFRLSWEASLYPQKQRGLTLQGCALGSPLPVNRFDS